MSERSTEAHHAKHEEKIALHNENMSIERKHAAKHETEPKHSANELTEHISSLQQSIERIAARVPERPIERLNAAESSRQHAYVSKELKLTAKNRVLTQAQRRLNPIERSFSKVLHTSVVDHASELGAKTIARPSGITGGGIFASIGSLTFYIIARKYGFDYNHTILITCFVAGYFIGLLVELIFYVLGLKKTNRNT